LITARTGVLGQHHLLAGLALFDQPERIRLLIR
jgi:hypothetical protein